MTGLDGQINFPEGQFFLSGPLCFGFLACAGKVGNQPKPGPDKR
jgi:hypothetical protein